MATPQVWKDCETKTQRPQGNYAWLIQNGILKERKRIKKEKRSESKTFNIDGFDANC